jgi:peptidoglycan biosynthesis protein MviN/MurJ (putative lipid II flippase)
MGGARILLFGTVAGALLSFVVQARVARLDGFRETWVSPFRRGEGQSILASMIPFAFVLGLGGDYGTGQVDIFLVRLFASRLTPGSVTLLALGNKLMALPVVFIGAALGLALLPSLSVAIAKESWEKATRDFAQAMSYAFLAVCPVAVIYFDLGVPMARMAFGRTALTPNQLEHLGAILSSYAGAVIGLVLVYILNSYLAALRRTRALIGAGVATAAIDALLMAVLWHRYQAPGIAAAISIGSFFYCGLLLALLAKYLPRVVRAELLVRAIIIVIGAVGMHLVLIFTARLNVFTSTPVFSNAIFPIVAGLLMYVAWLVLHRVRLQFSVASL